MRTVANTARILVLMGSRGRSTTFKITSESHAMSVAVKLEGRLAGPHVDAFDQQWQRELVGLGSKELVIDLREVTFADPAGRQLLKRIFAKTRATFLSDNLLTKYLADEATHYTKQNAKTSKSKASAKKVAKEEGN